MATKKFAVGAVLALVIGGAGVPLAFAGGDDDEGGNGHGDHARVLQLVLRHIQDTDVDLGASGPSVNDRFSVFGDVLQDRQKVGTGGYDCVTLNFQAGATPQPEPAALTDPCTASFTLPRGQITAQGLVDRVGGTLPIAIAVTGGTGAYRTAHGQQETSGPTDDHEPFTLKLILDD
jgi:hypothetical protein